MSNMCCLHIGLYSTVDFYDVGLHDDIAYAYVPNILSRFRKLRSGHPKILFCLT